MNGTQINVPNIDLGALGKFIAAVGVPAALSFLVITQLGPKIDHGIAVADHVDAELQFLAARGCGITLAPNP